MKSSNGILKIMPVIASCIILLSACSNSAMMANISPDTFSYPRQQEMIIVANERNRYEKVYTDGIWDVKLENGDTFETYLLDQVLEFLTDLRTMNLLADNRDIVLTNNEKDSIAQLAESYYKSLTDDDREYIGASLEDVEAMYREYYIANKVVSELTKDVDMEVSDSEAKVIHVRIIRLDDLKEAEDAYINVTSGDDDFASVARDISLDGGAEVEITREELDPVLEEAAFSLEEGEISPIVESDGSYYIFYCVDDYDVDATNLHKERLSEERKSQAFRQLYVQFAGEEVLYADDSWDDIHFSSEDRTTTDNFFELYDEWFGE